MQKLTAGEDAKARMTEAREWGVWRWLMEKGRVRVAADRATDALAQQEKKVKAQWPAVLKTAYRALERPVAGNGKARELDPLMLEAVQKVRKADEAAEAARLEAEATFDEAERRLSASMAREGTQKAIASWELREKAIRKAEALARAQSAPTAPGASHSTGA
jgi:hypothetical protein